MWSTKPFFILQLSTHPSNPCLSSSEPRASWGQCPTLCQAHEDDGSHFPSSTSAAAPSEGHQTCHNVVVYQNTQPRPRPRASPVASCSLCHGLTPGTLHAPRAGATYPRGPPARPPGRGAGTESGRTWRAAGGGCGALRSRRRGADPARQRAPGRADTASRGACTAAPLPYSQGYKPSRRNRSSSLRREHGPP